MKIINVNNEYNIYDDCLRTYDKLPVGTYTIGFHPMKGFWLIKTDDIKVEEKIYGIHASKVEKIMNSYNIFNRNLGVILSGKKGIGKSITAKLIAQESVKRGLPVILVNNNLPGIADYIGDIKQEVCVIFDEFDKIFGKNLSSRDDCDEDESIREKLGSSNSQNKLLTLFDGLDLGKKLFVITCNELNNLSEYLVNRPGRFHYHLRFNCPTKEEIEEYLRDKLDNYNQDDVDKIIEFSSKVDINYDCLRAIAFELNLGYSFKEAIQDLNIINIDNQFNQYIVTLLLSDGTKMVEKNYYLDFYGFDSEDECIYFHDDSRNAKVKFNVESSFYDSNLGCQVVDGKHLKLEIARRRGDGDDDKSPKANTNVTPVKLICKRKSLGNIHYMV